MTRKKKGANLTYYWCPTLKTTSWDENMPCDVDVHKITDNKSGGMKKEDEELLKKWVVVNKSHNDDQVSNESFQKKMDLASQGKFDTKAKSSFKKVADQMKTFPFFSKIETPHEKTIREHNEKCKNEGKCGYKIKPRFGIGGKRKKLMCPKNCCGLPVKKCACPVSCKHCNCHEIKRLRNKLSRAMKKRKTRRKKKRKTKKRKKRGKRKKKKTRR